MISDAQIQQRIIEAIKQSGMTQTALANALNVSQQTISHYIKGNKMPAVDTLANLCKILDVDTNYILCQDLK
ncbi:MAG: helix-turn-helix domain-containing protein [Clostridia bacterium]|nr:helix-turn-helix domain-containing protein [Clostridia bacterium]